MPPIKEKSIPFQNKDQKWGYINALTHQVVIQPKYDDAGLFENGVACVANLNKGKGNNAEADFLYGYINSNGQELFPPVYDGKYEVKTKSGKPLEDLISFTKNGQTGIAKKNGEWMFPLGMYSNFIFFDSNHVVCNQTDFYANGIKYQALKGYTIFDIDIENGLFYIRKDELSNGICKWTGEIIIPARYMEIKYHKIYNRFVAEKSTLKLSPKMSVDQISNVMLKAEEKGLDRIETTLFDKKGSQLGIYRSIYSLDIQDSMLFILSKGKERYINMVTGKEILKPDGKSSILVNNITQLHSSIFIKDGKYGLTNIKGDITIQPIYSDLSPASEELYTAANEKGYGLIDDKGKIIIPLQYQTIFDTKQLNKTKETYYQVQKDDKWGLMDKHGKLIIPIQYGYVSIDSTDLDKGWVKVEDEPRAKNGAVNIITHKSISILYDLIIFHDDLIEAAIYHHDKYNYQLLNQEGNPVSSEIYTSLNSTNNHFIAEKDNKYGLLDKQGKEILTFKYQYLSFRSADLLLATTNNMKLYVDINGTEYIAK